MRRIPILTTLKYRSKFSNNQYWWQSSTNCSLLFAF